MLHYMWDGFEAACGTPADEVPVEQRVTRLVDWANAAILDQPMCPACVADVAKRTGATQRWDV